MFQRNSKKTKRGFLFNSRDILEEQGEVYCSTVEMFQKNNEMFFVLETLQKNTKKFLALETF